MYFKILVVFAFILRIYSHLCKATNLYRLFTIFFYWSKATFMVYMKKYIYISFIYYIYIIHIYKYIYYVYIHIYIYIYIYVCILVLIVFQYLYFIFTSFCSNLTILTNFWVWCPFSAYSKSFRRFDPFSEFQGKNKQLKHVNLSIIMYILDEWPIMQRFICSFDLVSRFD